MVSFLQSFAALFNRKNICYKSDHNAIIEAAAGAGTSLTNLHRTVKPDNMYVRIHDHDLGPTSTMVYNMEVGKSYR